MKTINALKIASVAAMLAIAGPAIAQDANPPVAQDEPGSPNTDPLTDETGMASLGIDISAAGTSPESVQAFLATLAPDVQTKVMNGCATINQDSTTVNARVASFCQALGS